MKICFRTEVITQVFLSEIKANGGHVGLFSQSVDWVRFPSIYTEDSCICLRDETEYVLGLYDSTSLNVAVIGYNIKGKSCVVYQLQGLFAGELLLLRGWERTLLATIVRLAKLSGLTKVEVVPSHKNRWYPQGEYDKALRNQFHLRYDVTSQFLGFNIAHQDSNENHVLRLT
ncbi:hypothetical protein HQ403_00720 [Candidatus Kaiserbacteria bacterium]|nr:hypothetical protein [Candidatus Kaiserbacteria bacterium]